MEKPDISEKVRKMRVLSLPESGPTVKMRFDFLGEFASIFGISGARVNYYTTVPQSCAVTTIAISIIDGIAKNSAAGRDPRHLDNGSEVAEPSCRHSTHGAE